MICFLQNSTEPSYWFETGTPTFLINLLKTKNYPVLEFENAKVSESELGSFEIDNIDLRVLLFQTGYLTIKEYNQTTRNYILGYPNQECTNTLSEHIIKSMSPINGGIINEIVARLLQAFKEHNFADMQNIITQLFAAVPYTIHIGEEKYYQTIFYLILKMVGADIVVEQPTNIGRLDVVIQTNDAVFILEFKINSSALKAIQQIEEKKYYQPYLLLKKKIFLIGVSFDTTIKNISDFMHKEFSTTF